MGAGGAPLWWALFPCLGALAGLAPGVHLPHEADHYNLTTLGPSVELILRRGSSKNGDVLLNITVAYDTNFTSKIQSALKQEEEPHREKMRSLVESLLFQGAGGRCAACKTAVEEYSFQIETVRNRMQEMMPGLLRSEELSGNDAMSRHVLSNEFKRLCRDGSYREGKYSNEYKRVCYLVLGSNEFQKVMGDVDTATDSWISEMKRKLCMLETMVCPRKRKAPSLEMTQCRLCAETVQDLTYVLLRTNRSGFYTPRPLKKGLSNAYLGKTHIQFGLQEVCSNTNLRHASTLESDFEEKCEELTEHSDVIFRATVVNGQLVSNPAHNVCVHAIEDCSELEFAQVWPHLESNHLYNASETGNVSVAQNQLFTTEMARPWEAFWDESKSAVGEDAEL